MGDRYLPSSTSYSNDYCTPCSSGPGSGAYVGARIGGNVHTPISGNLNTQPSKGKGMRAARVDRNQAEIVKALRNIGCSVQHLHRCGEGVPDLLVGVRRRNFLLECKDGKKPPSARELTPDQVDWHIEWRGQVAVITSVDEALALVMETL